MPSLLRSCNPAILQLRDPCRSSFRRALGYLVPYWRRAGDRRRCSAALNTAPDPHASVSDEDAGRWRAGRPRSRVRCIATVRSFARGVARRVRADGHHRAALHGACRPTSSSTCGWRSIGTCSASRRGSTRARRSATSWRGVNNDVSEIQRVAAESLLAWVGNVALPRRQHRRDVLARLPGWRSSASRSCRVAVWVLSRTRTTLAAHVRNLREASAAIGSFLDRDASRRCGSS